MCRIRKIPKSELDIANRPSHLFKKFTKIYWFSNNDSLNAEDDEEEDEQYEQKDADDYQHNDPPVQTTLSAIVWRCLIQTANQK